MRIGLFLSGLCLVINLFGAEPPESVVAGSKRTAARIDEILRTTDPLQNPFRNIERAEIFRKKVEETKSKGRNSPEHFAALMDLALERLRAGEMEESLTNVAELREILKAVPGFRSPRTLQAVDSIEILDYLRIGEVENCFALHGPDSCLLPFRPGAFHKKPRGSREAIRLLTPILEKNPNDRRSRWLLNLAYMTLGEYPDKVPPAQRIDPKVFDSEYDIKRFTNIAAPLGLEVAELAGAVVAEDFDNDGDLDLLTSNWDVREKVRFFENRGGEFIEKTDEAGLKEARGGLNMLQADYNNDGFLDVLLLRGAWQGAGGRYPKTLFRNNGDSTFSDVSHEASVATEHPSQTAVWFDYNNDGWIDLFVGNEGALGATGRCELFRNNKNGTFTDVARECGVDILAFVKGTAGGDFNNDGRIDLYLSCANQPNRLLRNDGPGQGSAWNFTDVTQTAGVAEPGPSFPTWFFDYDNDGWQDIFVAGYFVKNLGDALSDYMGENHTSERLRLWRNKGNGTFEDVTKSVNLHKFAPAMGSNFGDLDNDGFLDFYLATGDPDNSTLIPNRMFRNDGGKRFQDVTTSGGFGHLQKGHAVAFADFDHDGDQDVYTVMGGAYSGDTARNVLFENPGHGNRWIKLKLEGVQSNRAAIGARLKVTVATTKGDRVIYKTLNSGGSFGANPLRQEIGLGDATAVKSLEVFWPTTGKTQAFPGLELDRAYKIREGEAKAEVQPLKPIPFAVAKQ